MSRKMLTKVQTILDKIALAIYSLCEFVASPIYRSDKIDPSPFPVFKEMWSHEIDFLLQIQKLDIDVVSFIAA